MEPKTPEASTTIPTDAPHMAPEHVDTPATAPVADPNLLIFKESSNVRSARFDEATGIVTVTFANERTYRYSGFTAALMREWSEAKSHGGWFHANVRQHPEAHPVIGDDGKPVRPAAAIAPQPPAQPPQRPAAAPSDAVNAEMPAPATPSTKRAKQWWKDRPWKNGGKS